MIKTKLEIIKMNALLTESKEHPGYLTTYPPDDSLAFLKQGFVHYPLIIFRNPEKKP